MATNYGFVNRLLGYLIQKIEEIMGSLKETKETWMFQKGTKINVDLWPSDAWTQTDLQEFVDLFQEFEPTSGQLSSDTRGIGVQIVITVAASAVAAGFFGKLGSDLYEFVKARLKKVLVKSVAEASESIEFLESTGLLAFCYCDPELGLSDVFYRCVYSKGSDLDLFLSHLQQVDNLIREACNNQKFPFDRGRNYDIYAKLETSPQVSWNARVRRYEEQNGDLILNEFFRSRFRISELENLKWEQIKWV